MVKNPITSLVDYRGFIYNAVIRELKQRFSRSKVGFVWMLIHPLVMVLIYTLILSKILNAKLPGTESIYGYSIFLMSGILVWTIFSEAVSRGLNLFILHAEFIKKVSFPKNVLVWVLIGHVTINAIILTSLILLVLISLGHPVTLDFLWLPVLYTLLLLFSVSMGVFLGTLNVFFRDVGQVTPVVLQLGFWLTPIVYSLNLIPIQHHHWFQLNPMSHFVAPFQNLFLYGHSPSIKQLIVIICLTGVAAFMSIFLYKRSHLEMADEL